MKYSTQGDTTIVHIGLKRKIQRLLKVNFVHRNFIRLDLQKVRQSRATNRVSGAATIKSFQFTSTLATQSHPKFSKEHPNWKFWACVKCFRQTSLGPVELVTMLHLWNWSHMFCTCGIGHNFFSGNCGIGHNFWDQFHNLYESFGFSHRQKIIVE